MTVTLKPANPCSIPVRAVVPTAAGGSPATSLGCPCQGLLSQGALSHAFQPSRARVPAQEQDGRAGRGQKEAQGGQEGQGSRPSGATWEGSLPRPVLLQATCWGERQGSGASTPSTRCLQSLPLGPDGLKEKHWKVAPVVTAGLRHSQLCPS